MSPESSQQVAQLLARIETLEAKNRRLCRYAVEVCHDLKAPLRAIHTYADFLREDLGPALDGPCRQHLERLFDAVERADSLVQGRFDQARGDDPGDGLP